MMHKDYILGLDGGGTSTVCLLTDREGCVLGRVDAPASNYRKVGLRETREALSSGIESVARQAGINAGEQLRFASVCAGLAGVDTPEDAATLRALLCELVTTDHLQIVNDGEIALAGALENEPGALVISGTGSIAWASATDGRRIRVGGWDYILADEGSGYSIGLRVLRAVAAAHDGRLVKTCLTGGVFRFFDTPNFHKLLGVIYHEDMTPQRIAALAPLADEAAANGDAAAVNILHEAAKDLATLAASAVRMADLNAQPFPIAAMGGVLLSNGFFADAFRHAMIIVAPTARFITPRHTPVEGSILLALCLLDSARSAAPGKVWR